MSITAIWAGRGRLYIAGWRSAGLAGGSLFVAAFDPGSLAAGTVGNSPIVLSETITAPIIRLTPDGTLLHVVYSHNRTHLASRTVIDAVFDPDSLRLIGEKFVDSDANVQHLATRGTPSAPVVRALNASDSRIRLRWEPTTGATPQWFAIRGARRGEAPALVDIVNADQQMWESPVLPPGSYTVDVAALNRGGSNATRVAAAVDDPQTPSAPTQLAVTVADDLARLAWQPSESGAAASGFVVEAASAGATTFSEATRVTLPEFIARRVPHGTWQVRVRAFTAGGVSAPSNVVTIASSPCASAPDAPTGLSSIVTSQLVTLRWTTPSAGSAEEYVVEAGTASGAINLGRVPSGSAYPSIQVSAPAGTYFVRVRARNPCGESGLSHEIVVWVR